MTAPIAAAAGAVPVATQRWQVTLDEIKAKVQDLLRQNDQLSQQYKYLLAEQKKAALFIEKQSRKNEKLRDFLKVRNGKSDQQIRIEELERQIAQRKDKLASIEKYAQSLKLKSQYVLSIVEDKKLKISEWELKQSAATAEPAPSKPEITSGDAELDALRKDLETQKAEEVKLEQELNLLAQKAKNPELKRLFEDVERLSTRKDDLLKKSQEKAQGAAKGRSPEFDSLMRQKTELEKRIGSIEDKINVLKNPASGGLAWDSMKKRMVEDMVFWDRQNADLRGKINNVREDITLLEQEIRKLEKKNGGGNGKTK